MVEHLKPESDLIRERYYEFSLEPLLYLQVCLALNTALDRIFPPLLTRLKPYLEVARLRRVIIALDAHKFGVHAPQFSIVVVEIVLRRGVHTVEEGRL